jgi:hypothetical protein
MWRWASAPLTLMVLSPTSMTAQRPPARRLRPGKKEEQRKQPTVKLRNNLREND